MTIWKVGHGKPVDDVAAGNKLGWSFNDLEVVNFIN